MKAEHVEEIANLVVAGLASGPGAGLLGCGAISSTQPFDCPEPSYECTDGYECGGQATFSCTAVDTFTCLSGFACGQPGAPSGFSCVDFSCPQGYQGAF